MGIKMIDFCCDYAEGAHEKILEALLATNKIQTPGYGEDAYCREAAQAICRACQCDTADVHFLVGGTQTNLTVISTALRPYQGVISAQCGHIAVHETGAIEATGHKVLALPSADGKITAKQIREVYEQHVQDSTHEHMVQPKMVYLSNPTEYGTIYQLAELKEIAGVCKECGFYLYMDGARLGYGLVAQDNDLDLPAIAGLCDAFYIGGTKCGALFGEAVVITNPELKPDFRYMIKQKGGMLAKGRLLGIQFKELFRDGLYYEICAYADELAMKMKAGFLKKGWELYVDSNTNQQFPIITNEILIKIRDKYRFSDIAALDDERRVVRFCTSWATREEDVAAFLEDLKLW